MTLRTRLFAALAASATLSAVTVAPAVAADTNLAAGRPASASSSTDVYAPANITDGNANSYWESNNNAFPQYVQVDLGASDSISSLVAQLPPSSSWSTRTETFSVSTSADGSSFATAKASAGYTFDPAANNNTVNIPLTATARFVRLTFTANTGWPAGQLSELQVLGSTSSGGGGGGGGGTPPSGTNLAQGRPISGSANTYVYAPANANDGDLTTYFEGASYPSTLTVSLGSDTDLSAVTVALNPSSSWGARTQTIAVLGRTRGGTSFTTLSAAKSYGFDPATGNKVSIPVTGKASDVELSITANSGAPGGQVAEFGVYGSPSANPDLTVVGSSWSPAKPVETDSITASATVKNIGTQSAAATSVNFYLGTRKVGTASVGALAAGASTTVSASIGAQSAGSYSLRAVVDETNAVAEQNENNNSYTNPTALVVSAVQSADLVVAAVTTNPSHPAAGNTVSFQVTVKNQGNQASSSASHGITLTLKDGSGATKATATGSSSGAIAAGASVTTTLSGSWTAVNGKYTEHVVVAADANEVSVKQANNTSDTSLFVGRGANMPYDTYEAEDGVLAGGAKIVGPNRTVGDLAGEASGRKAVTLTTTGASVSWTTKAATNTLVTRFSIPDSSGGGGTTATLDVMVDGKYLKSITLTSKYAWLYGQETGPGNDPSAGGPRHIYDEANLMLGTTVPAGHTIALQKNSGNTSQYAIDFIDLEQVSAIANPDAGAYVTPTGFGQQDVQNALDKARMDTTGTIKGVYLPAGDYDTSSKFQVYGKTIKVIGAGPWFTRFHSPTTQDNTDDGFAVSASANGSSFTGFSWFGNYTSRIDGPGKVFDLADVSALTLSNIWVEHQVCFVWGSHVSNLTITDDRIRDTFADGINLNNGSQNNLVSNVEARSTGDDSFALFAAQDHSSDPLTGNTFQNITSLLTWRAAGIAIYGGYGNTVNNFYVADTLVYSGITLSSLDFGYPFAGFGANPKTVIQNGTLLRDGGHFYGAQTFPAIWVFSASKPFQGIRVNSVDIIDPTYTGIMFQTKYDGPSSPENPVTDTVFTDVSISGAHHTGDAYDAKSGYAIWVNPLPESGQGPAVGSATFTRVTFSNNDVNVQNTTSTFTLNFT